MPTDTSEKGLEDLIEESLLTKSDYLKGSSKDYNRSCCLDTKLLMQFLRQTQADKIAKLEAKYGTDFQDRLFKRISNQVESRGIVDTLRYGITDDEKQEFDLILYYKQPASQLNFQTIQNYDQNIFSITRQLRFSNASNQSVDLVIFINGLPIITFEIKNNLTGQNIRHAIRQYQNDRDPREPLFKFARCLVHFAVDDDLVYMTTELKGEQTIFIPFNKGRKSQSGIPFPDSAGNPVNPNGLKTDYLWKEILKKPSLSNIVEKYTQIVKQGEQKKRKLIFPRYHQLDLVRKLLADTKTSGVGRRYLIQHSAGSGKSNSITWLSHQLVELTDAQETKSVFDSVIVITDRVVLDRQIRDSIKQFTQIEGVVTAISKDSKQLAEALESGKKLIITNVYKFPLVVKKIKSLKGKRYAIIIDEAHSSQGGKTAAKMNVTLTKEQAEEEQTTEEKILKFIEQEKLSDNASYFAFTATPKNKTLETFGTRNPVDNKFYPFHNYSMKQAIEEEFILDVLENYTTYKSYYKLQECIEFDPQFETRKAKRELKKFVHGHPDIIRQKAEIMIDHFLKDVLGQGKIKGEAKAMLVTSGIDSAKRYKRAFDAYLKDINSPYKAIVAFSGSKTVDGKKEDEDSMNGFASSEIPKQFKKSEYRFLIVANKYQTGFDEPLLHTMYVDKSLRDINAVQTLSRLNRAYKPDKQDTFILDFVNSAKTIKAAFDPFYKTSILSEETSVNQLQDLQTALDGFAVYTREKVETLMDRFINDAERDQLDPILDECKQYFLDSLNADEQVSFKNKATAFVRNYQFLVQIRPFRNSYWESLKVFLKLLVCKLPSISEQDSIKGILDSVDVHSYRVEREATLAIQLEGTTELATTSLNATSRKSESKLDSLSKIVQDFNTNFGNIEWTEKDKVQHLLFEELPAKISQDEEYQNAKQNSGRQNAKITFNDKLVDIFQDFISTHTEVYRKFMESSEFKTWLSNRLFSMDYDDQDSA